MSFKNWELRKQVMADNEMSVNVRFHALLVIDHVDWSTGRKVFTGAGHMVNWLKLLAQKNNVSALDLQRAVEVLNFLGYANVSPVSLTLYSDYELQTQARGLVA